MLTSIFTSLRQYYFSFRNTDWDDYFLNLITKLKKNVFYPLVIGFAHFRGFMLKILEGNYLMDLVTTKLICHWFSKSWGEAEQSWSGSKCLSPVRRSFPHVFAGSTQGRINRVEKFLGIFSLQQAEKKKYFLSVN